MRTRLDPAFRIVVAAASLAAFGGARADAADPFHAFVTPDTTLTGVDSLVCLNFAVDSTAHHFNAYKVTLQFDPAVLRFEGVTEGVLFVQYCPTRFRVLTQTDSTVTYAHSLLCDGVTLDGPGVVSRYAFRALAHGVSPVSIVSSPDSTFLDAGEYINPSHPTEPREVTMTGAVVIVDMESGVPPEGTGEGSFAYAPNPSRSGGVFRGWREGGAPVSLLIVDASGREVFAAESGAAREGEWTMAWDGRDAAGRPLAPGIYVARLQSGDRAETGKIVVMP